MLTPYYEANGITIYHGDCLEIMPLMKAGSMDALLTDPPYTAAGGSTNGRTNGADNQFFSFWMRSVLAEVRRVLSPAACGFLFCDWRTIGLLADAMRPAGERQTAPSWTVQQALVWDREHIGLGSPFRNSFEMIAFARGPKWSSELRKDIPTVIRHRFPYGAHPHHGAEKPIGLCEMLLSWALPGGGALFDPFCGSGTAAMAAARRGCRYVGIEIEERYCEVAAERLRQHQMALGPAC